MQWIKVSTRGRHTSWFSFSTHCHKLIASRRLIWWDGIGSVGSSFPTVDHGPQRELMSTIWALSRKNTNTHAHYLNTHRHTQNCFLTPTANTLHSKCDRWDSCNDDNGDGDCTLDTVGGEEGDVAGFQRVVMGTVRWPGLGLWFAGQGWVVHLVKCAKERRHKCHNSSPITILNIWIHSRLSLVRCSFSLHLTTSH